jgi:hypothetical protein
MEPTKCPKCGEHDVIYLIRYLMWCRACAAGYEAA